MFHWDAGAAFGLAFGFASFCHRLFRGLKAHKSTQRSRKPMGPVGSAGTCSSGLGWLLALCHDALLAGPRLLSPFPLWPCGPEMVWMGSVQPCCVPSLLSSCPGRARGFQFGAMSGTLFGTDFSGYFGELFLPDPGLHKSEVLKGPGLALQEQ